MVYVTNYEYFGNGCIFLVYIITESLLKIRNPGILRMPGKGINQCVVRRSNALPSNR